MNHIFHYTTYDQKTLHVDDCIAVYIKITQQMILDNYLKQISVFLDTQDKCIFLPGWYQSSRKITSIFKNII